MEQVQAVEQLRGTLGSALAALPPGTRTLHLPLHLQRERRWLSLTDVRVSEGLEHCGGGEGAISSRTHAGECWGAKVHKESPALKTHRLLTSLRLLSFPSSCLCLFSPLCR